MTDGSEVTGAGPAISVRLEPGSHRSPRDGVCIVELASILGGEPFSDRPRCVCRVIGSFLRGWNDRAGYAERQRLHPYAVRVVGTGGYRRSSRIRRDLCLRWAGADLDRGPLGRSLARLAMRIRIAWAVGVVPAVRLKEGAGAYAARVCFARGSDEAFALLDRLLEIGPPTAGTPPRASGQWAPAKLDGLAGPNRNGDGRQNGNGDGNGNGHRRDEAGIGAKTIVRERGNPRTAEPRSLGAPGSGSASGGGGDYPRDSRAPLTDAGS